mgnify:CR=1 FL=1
MIIFVIIIVIIYVIVTIYFILNSIKPFDSVSLKIFNFINFAYHFNFVVFFKVFSKLNEFIIIFVNFLYHYNESPQLFWFMVIIVLINIVLKIIILNPYPSFFNIALFIPMIFGLKDLH